MINAAYGSLSLRESLRQPVHIDTWLSSIAACTECAVSASTSSTVTLEALCRWAFLAICGLARACTILRSPGARPHFKTASRSLSHCRHRENIDFLVE